MVASAPLPNQNSSVDPVPDATLAIAVRGVDMIFGSKTQPFQALQGVNLDVHPATLQLLLGPAGAGKTTLLYVIAGLLTPTAGEIWLLDQPLSRLSRTELEQLRLQSMGMVFQDINLLRSLTVQENVELALQFRGIQGADAHQQSQALLSSLGLEPYCHQMPRLLSVGQQQRLGVARALAGSPRLIIADEPTSALDSVNSRLVMQLLRDRVDQQGCTVLLSTHDQRLLTFADQATYLEDGRITRIELLNPQRQSRSAATAPQRESNRLSR